MKYTMLFLLLTGCVKVQPTKPVECTITPLKFAKEQVIHYKVKSFNKLVCTGIGSISAYYIDNCTNHYYIHTNSVKNKVCEDGWFDEKDISE